MTTSCVRDQCLLYITDRLPQNFIKTGRQLHVDDLMVTYAFLLSTWVAFEVQSVSGDVKLDLSVATWVSDPTEDSFYLWVITLITVNMYSF
jgi:hypothetical protein